MRVVTPFRPFAPESDLHRALGPFDWHGAIQMLRASVRRAMDCDTVTLTAVDTTVPGPMFRYETTEQRLMLWILEVSLCYLRSADFDDDTVFLSPDQLVFGDLQPWLGEFTILMRSSTKYQEHPILNGVQFWPLARKRALIDFFARALTIGRTLEEDFQRWGADTEPLRRLLQPLTPGLVVVEGHTTVRVVEADDVLQAFTSRMADDLTLRGHATRPTRAVLDFRFLRKRYMRAYFERTLGALETP